MSLANTINKQEIISATDQCVMCGLCLPHCPTYTIGQTEAESPRGRIALVRALYEGKLEASETISSHLNHCLTCMNCERVCPANVDYEKIIDAGRAISGKKISLFRRAQQFILFFVLANTNARKVFKTCISIFRTIGFHRLFSNIRLFSLLPEPSKALSNFSAPAVDGPEVVIINTCAGDLVNDEVQTAATSILSKLGCNIIAPKQTLCCGALHQHTGDLKTAKKLRQNFIHSINLQNPDYLISLATGCGAQIKRYSKLNGGPNDGSEKQLNTKLLDVNEFVLQQIKDANFSFKPLAKKVFLHQPCSLAQVTKDATVVERLLNFIPEIELATFEDKLVCCGAGGINTLTQSRLAEQLIDDKILELKNTNASYLVSSNIGCALHFQAKIRHEGINIQVLHPITLLAQQVI